MGLFLQLPGRYAYCNVINIEVLMMIDNEEIRKLFFYFSKDSVMAV